VDPVDDAFDHEVDALGKLVADLVEEAIDVVAVFGLRHGQSLGDESLDVKI
jgi:hypothetical protein